MHQRVAVVIIRVCAYVCECVVCVCTCVCMCMCVYMCVCMYVCVATTRAISFMQYSLEFYNDLYK